MLMKLNFDVLFMFPKSPPDKNPHLRGIRFRDKQLAHHMTIALLGRQVDGTHLSKNPPTNGSFKLEKKRFQVKFQLKINSGSPQQLDSSSVSFHLGICTGTLPNLT